MGLERDNDYQNARLSKLLRCDYTTCAGGYVFSEDGQISGRRIIKNRQVSLLSGLQL
jgi:hypothetical protein